MIEIKKSQDFEDLKVILRESDARVDAWFKEFMESVAEMYLHQVMRRIPKGDEFKEYRESFRAWISTEMNRAERISYESTRQISRPELYWSGIEAVGDVKGFNQLWMERTLVKVKKARNTDLSFKDLLLFRYQPWTLDTVPFLPVGENIYFVYEDIGVNEFYKLRIKARKKSKKARSKVASRGMPVDSEEHIISNFRAISNLFDIALKLELGIMGQKKAHWTPASEFVAKTGIKTLLKNKRVLQDIIFKRGFRGWKNRKPRLEDIPKNRVESMKEFVERIT